MRFRARGLVETEGTAGTGAPAPPTPPQGGLPRLGALHMNWSLPLRGKRHCTPVHAISRCGQEGWAAGGAVCGRWDGRMQ